LIAKHIPTKRELKPFLVDLDEARAHDCKAHPDEKGIETEVAQDFWGLDF